MKIMSYGNVKCEVRVSEGYSLAAWVLCDYGRDTIAYAVEKYFAGCSSPDARPQQRDLCRRCTCKSWQLRVQKGKPQTVKPVFVIPAKRMELPGKWVRVSGQINKCGFIIDRVELLKTLPSGAPGAEEGRKGKKKEPRQRKISLRELFEGYTGPGPEPFDWGIPYGREVW